MAHHVLDIETYTNYFLVMVRPVAGGVPAIVYERFNDVVTVNNPLPTGTVITFNGNNYDMPMLSLAATGANNATLKQASDRIIKRPSDAFESRRVMPWDLEGEFGFERLALDHIDLFDVAPGKASLKLYAGRLHSRRLQDLPIPPDAIITEGEVLQLRDYCGNSDLPATVDLFNRLKPQIDLRVEMSAEFGIDLRSKSDAQIAEAVIKSEVEKRIGSRVYKPKVNLNFTFPYRAPAWVAFQTPGMKNVLRLIHEQTFTLNKVPPKKRDDSPLGSVIMPVILDHLHIQIGQATYKMGIGGLHSTEKSVSYRAGLIGPGGRIVDRDVTSYYPSLILNAHISPPAYGYHFASVYHSILERRVAAKRSGNKVINEALKIVLNGTFGKLGSIWSMMYAPDQMIAVTLTGQLALLMLIESLDAVGIRVVSANTDGIVSLVPAHMQDTFEAVVACWEMTTGFNTEETEYAAIYAKDVNNYFAVKPDGTVKLKGLYSPGGLQKNITNPICVSSVVAYLAKGVPIQDTVRGCTDPRMFLTIRQVDGGAIYDEKYLGKAVRWYYGEGETRGITYKSNGNKVARSLGARPCMELPMVIPPDLDWDWYIREACCILEDIGA